MSECPDPMTPAGCDLRDFSYMPLDVVRLRDSDIASIDSEAFRGAVLAWCVAWHQTPAASLPDDDTILCRLLGYGRDIRGWQKTRAAGALHGFILCADGRLYHPVVAEKALEAWKMKLDRRERTEGARIAKRAKAAGLSVDEYTTRLSQPKPDEPKQLSQALSQRRSPSVTENVTDDTEGSVTASNEWNGMNERKKRELSSLWRERDFFDREFLSRYPNKAKPDAAFRAWGRALKLADATEIIAGILVYPFRDEPKFQPLASNWLDDGGWKIAPDVPISADPEAAAKRAGIVEGWLQDLRAHHGDEINGTTVSDLDRVSRKFTGSDFVRFLDAIKSGDPWILGELHSVATT